MSRVIDRTRPVRHGKGKQPLRYEVVIFATEFEWEQETGTILAKFLCKGDAYLWAQSVREPCFCLVVRN